MEDIRFEGMEELDKFLGDDRYLGKGREGLCYKVLNKTYKLYYSDYWTNNPMEIEQLLKFRDLLVENVYFIRGLVYVKDKMVASITDYAVGRSCGLINLCRCNLDRLVVALATLKKTIYELSELGIYVDDIFAPNILYDGNSFKLIDTSGYLYSTEIGGYGHENKDDILVIYGENMKAVIRELFRGITDMKYENDNFIYSFLLEVNSPYKDYLVDSDLLMHPDKTIIGIRDTVCEYVGREIDSFSNCRRDLLRIRKK